MRPAGMHPSSVAANWRQAVAALRARILGLTPEEAAECAARLAELVEGEDKKTAMVAGFNNFVAGRASISKSNMLKVLEILDGHRFAPSTPAEAHDAAAADEFDTAATELRELFPAHPMLTSEMVYAYGRILAGLVARRPSFHEDVDGYRAFVGCILDLLAFREELTTTHEGAVVDTVIKLMLEHCVTRGEVSFFHTWLFYVKSTDGDATTRGQIIEAVAKIIDVFRRTTMRLLTEDGDVTAIDHAQTEKLKKMLAKIVLWSTSSPDEQAAICERVSAIFAGTE
jgi:phage host-nuclease inhibitor protein Gam